MNDKQKATNSYLVSIICIVTAFALAFIYILSEPVGGLKQLILNVIPSAIVALLAFPFVYFILTRKGIELISASEVNMAVLSDRIISELHKNNLVIQKDESHPESMRKVESEMEKIIERVNRMENNVVSNNKEQIAMNRDALIVVDVQNDFFDSGALPVDNTTSLVHSLNDAIISAEKAGVLIIYTQDWHPKNHKSFKGFGGLWNPHCIQGTSGAKIHPRLMEAKSSELIKFGTDPYQDGYSPFENKDLVKLINRPEINEVFVVGIAVEYCVLATCIEAKKYKQSVTIIEDLVRSAEPEKISDTWETYEKYKIHRIKKHPWEESL